MKGDQLDKLYAFLESFPWWFVFNLVLTCTYHDCELTIQG